MASNSMFRNAVFVCVHVCMHMFWQNWIPSKTFPTSLPPRNQWAPDADAAQTPTRKTRHPTATATTACHRLVDRVQLFQRRRFRCRRLRRPAATWAAAIARRNSAPSPCPCDPTKYWCDFCGVAFYWLLCCVFEDAIVFFNSLLTNMAWWFCLACFWTEELGVTECIWCIQTAFSLLWRIYFIFL